MTTVRYQHHDETEAMVMRTRLHQGCVAGRRAIICDMGFYGFAKTKDEAKSLTGTNVKMGVVQLEDARFPAWIVG